MRVKLVRSGGLVGLKMVATVDSSDLPPDQQDVVSRLLTEDLRGPVASRPGAADQFSYLLEIQHGGRTVKRRWDEPEVLETVRPLLAGLTKAARPAR
jgi:hypothetical protein